MNRLEIAQDVNTLAGTQGTIDTTESITGYQAVLLKAVDKAYKDIQLYRNDWDFMKLEADIPLTTLVKTYSNVDIAKVDKIIYDQKIIDRVEYADWILRDHDTGTPREYTVNRATGLITFNTLDASYQPKLHYYRNPNKMTVNGSIPIVPLRYHDAITYKALMILGTYLGNYDLISEYSVQFAILMGAMMRDYVPSRSFITQPLV